MLTGDCQRRRYWPASLEDLEERIWIDQKGSFARLEVCRNQIDSFMDNTGGVRDNVSYQPKFIPISLVNYLMSSSAIIWPKSERIFSH
jgi:hypothetical protein